MIDCIKSVLSFVLSFCEILCSEDIEKLKQGHTVIETVIEMEADAERYRWRQMQRDRGEGR